MNLSSEIVYTSVSPGDEKWSDDVSDSTLHGPALYRRSSHNIRTACIAFCSLIIGIGAGVALSTLEVHWFSKSPLSLQAEGSHQNTAASPIWTDGINKIDTVWTRFNGSLYGSNEYRGEPSPELDAAWDRFTDHEFMPGTPLILGVSLSELHRSQNDFSPETAVQLDMDNGGGYMSSLEVFHQLHCLNVLRKWTYKEHYEKEDVFWQEGNRFHLREHTDHCIDMLRQTLMCQSDTGLVVFHWTKRAGAPSPYFSTKHSCRDPEQVLTWAKSIAKPVHKHIYKQGNEVELEDFPA